MAGSRGAVERRGGGEALSEPWPPDPEVSFASIIARARALDDDALSLLYRRYLPVVYRFVVVRVADVQVAEDVTSETFLGMVDTIERVRATDELSFAAWLLGIARHKVAEHYRRLQMRPPLHPAGEPWDEPLALAEAGDPLGVVTARESWAEVVAALQQLTEEQRTVLLYRCVLDYKTEQVARLLDRQPGAIRAVLFRALSTLARLLAASGTPPAISTVRAHSSRRTRPSRPSRPSRGQRSEHDPRR
jgi:RNA polymerase sigma-70 factor (ECF subfamily)